MEAATEQTPVSEERLLAALEQLEQDLDGYQPTEEHHVITPEEAAAILERHVQ